MNGVDPECRTWISRFREPAPEGQQVVASVVQTVAAALKSRILAITL